MTQTVTRPVPQKSTGIPAGKVAVKLPNLFQGFLKQTPPLNPYYEEVRSESERWLTRFCSLSPQMQMKLQKLDFSYFCAIMAPNAPRKEYRTICDWGNWVFPYDDMFDGGDLGGELKDDPIKSRIVVDSLLEPFLTGEVSKGRMRIVEAHDDVARRIFSTCTRGVRRRFLYRMHLYSKGVLTHLDDHFDGRRPTPEEMIETRRDSAGSGPLYHLVEYGHRLHVPNKVFKDPVIRELENLGMEMVCITNDLVSYQKEEGDGYTGNIVAACRMDGMSAQEAFDYVGRLLEERYRRWEAAEARVPHWEYPTNMHVAKYIEGIKAVVRANLYWSFRTKRYLGRDPEEVRRTGIIYVLKNPPYMVDDRTEKEETVLVRG
ncbi:Presilphiperfolan-8-beta-ol synthase-like protein [Hapsidospora chrysogenum ATCC 11550]|uniref:Terpene synthase n=1 Tax=Hapsidospora chrysogenum (strain ATCC 11550 / CBS 779.69 / DSM 880 / IAM 14645 / JCM 23072 / IMI 49137) TaxID=857340 RepID=A0A086TDM3_HAPC1|nr:Presilphiperfolan-8-beta-ol synthase-like protein [Hapsidospora chrysogenum ATCC 11550]WCB86512.1 sesquiterpen synthase TPS1 [Hapsidospora chrysogena]